MSNRLQRACVIGAATLALIAVCLAGIYVRFGGVWPHETDTSETETILTSAEPESTVPADTSTDAETEQSTSAEVTETPEPESTEESISETQTEAVTETEEVTEVPTQEAVQEPVGLQRAFIGRLALDVDKAPSVFVREAPTTESRTLTALYPRDVVRYTGMSGDFYEVQVNGITGYVHKDYVLTDMDCYESRKDYVAYAVMSPVTDVMLYATMDDTQPVMIASEKADEFKLAGIEDNGWFRVSVKTSKYDCLYLKQNEVILYPFFNYGDVSDLQDWELELLNAKDLSANIDRAEEIAAERKAELAAYKAYDVQVAQEKAKEEAEAKEAARKASAEQAARAKQEAEAAREQASSSGQAVLLGTDFTITKYCHCTKCCGKWGNDDPNYVAHGASGMNLIPGKSIAVDPNVIPYGSRVLINGQEYIAMDTTDHFYFGSHWIDIYCATHDETEIHGYRTNVTVYLLP